MSVVTPHVHVSITRMNTMLSSSDDGASDISSADTSVSDSDDTSRAI